MDLINDLHSAIHYQEGDDLTSAVDEVLFVVKEDNSFDIDSLRKDIVDALRQNDLTSKMRIGYSYALDVVDHELGYPV